MKEGMEKAKQHEVLWENAWKNAKQHEVLLECMKKTENAKLRENAWKRQEHEALWDGAWKKVEKQHERQWRAAGTPGKEVHSRWYIQT